MKDFSDIIDRGYGLIDLNYATDARGCLCYAEWQDLPFEPQRMFWIYDVNQGQSRGQHAHSECEEVVWAVKGGFEMFVDNGKEQTTIKMDNPHKGIYIGKNVWCELKNFQEGTVCVVVASVKYMHEGYIRNYEEFKRVFGHRAEDITQEKMSEKQEAKTGLTLVKYTPDRAEQWNRFVAESKNGTFMFDRNYMDYHSDRFEDASIMFIDKERVFAVLPANIDRKRGCICSHQGLTYGGLVMSDEMDSVRVLEAFNLLRNYYKEEYGTNTLLYKAVPHIYWRQTSGEDEYALYRCGAKLSACGLSSCVNLKSPISYERSRRNALKKAQKAGLKVEETNQVEQYWQILNRVLKERHGLKPVHSSEELELLMKRFPQNIKLYAVRDKEGEMIAGTYIFIYEKTIHTQYMTATDEARHCGALDLLIDWLIKEYAQSHEWLDFGISTEENGHWLNEGLIYQKEGFGGRGVCYNQYEIKL